MSLASYRAAPPRVIVIDYEIWVEPVRRSLVGAGGGSISVVQQKGSQSFSEFV